jgi:alkanesulfonate monooxygenase SsuD/methylene tetrahydromethanopterin reductase-like flavin-dependent oxidoreductase (luciferase family)
MAFVGHTKAEAQAKFDQLTALIHPEVGLRMILPMFGDLSHLPLDEPVSFEVIEAAKPDYNDFAKRDAITEHLIERIRLEKLTVRQIYGAIAEGYWQLGIIGTPGMIADRMEEWFTMGGCDGFIVQPPYIPLAVDDFVDLVIPELQRRGLFRKEYESATLRGNLGLARPVNQYATNRAG